MGLVRFWESKLDPLKGIQAPGPYKTKFLGSFLGGKGPPRRVPGTMLDPKGAPWNQVGRATAHPRFILGCWLDPWPSPYTRMGALEASRENNWEIPFPPRPFVSAVSQLISTQLFSLDPPWNEERFPEFCRGGPFWHFGRFGHTV